MIELGSSIFISVLLLMIIGRYLRRKDSKRTSDLKQVFFNVRGEESFEFTNDSDYELKISTEKMSSLREQVLEATENLKDEYIIGRGAHGIVYKAIIGQQVCAVKKLEFGRNNLEVEFCQIVFSNMFALSSATENAYDIVPGRKSDVYSYGVVLLELITRKKLLVPSINDEVNEIHIVTWAGSVMMETGKIENIVDPYLVSAFPNSMALTIQVTAVL
ncbi:unnamed protein product [Trifolium pratense]|uniref:Uncharacterized protein n=1 Tax=Trifolium pratense TaxID=57577 RepID=A0ACB0K8X3_TRIPR|nr:unnamed protein product [Trifolium pratense]